MRCFLILLVLLWSSAQAQEQRPSPDEVAFARLPAELQALLGHMEPGEALRQVEYARQNLIALGQPAPSRAQLRRTVETVLSPGYGVRSASAGETPFPPLSPLVAPPPPRYAR